MNRTFGLKEEFEYFFEDVSRVVICYDYEEVDDEHCTWRQIVFYKKQGFPDVKKVKDAILADINRQTEDKILRGFVWNDINVWLSEENQKNFSEAQRVAVMTEGASLPIKFKLGENEDEEPIYYTFNTVGELNSFYLSAVAFIQQCLNEGWERKDNIDFSVYEAIEPSHEVVEEE